MEIVPELTDDGATTSATTSISASNQNNLNSSFHLDDDSNNGEAGSNNGELEEGSPGHGIFAAEENACDETPLTASTLEYL